MENHQYLWSSTEWEQTLFPIRVEQENPKNWFCLVMEDDFNQKVIVIQSMFKIDVDIKSLFFHFSKFILILRIISRGNIISSQKKLN